MQWRHMWMKVKQKTMQVNTRANEGALFVVQASTSASRTCGSAKTGSVLAMI